MKYANRMTLVPYQEQMQEPKIEYMSELDRNMSKIISSKIPPDEKVKLYGQELNRLLLALPVKETPIPNQMTTTIQHYKKPKEEKTLIKNKNERKIKIEKLKNALGFDIEKTIEPKKAKKYLTEKRLLDKIEKMRNKRQIEESDDLNTSEENMENTVIYKGDKNQFSFGIPPKEPWSNKIFEYMQKNIDPNKRKDKDIKNWNKGDYIK